MILNYCNISDITSCEVKESNGFLKYICEHSNSAIQDTVYKCANTDDYYSEYGRTMLSGSVCPKDPHYYQVCGTTLSGKATNKELLCEFYLCWLNSQSEREMLKIYSSSVCDRYCINTDLNRVGCDAGENVVLPTGRKVHPSQICNDQCDAFMCEDEANCNGYLYGMYCIKNNKLAYVAPNYICRYHKYCDNGEDQAHCSVTDDTESYCRHAVDDRQIVPVFNFTRCALLIDSNKYFSQKYCKFEGPAVQQTNCSDTSRVGVMCEINGYKSTVSKYAICLDDAVTSCDDGIDTVCMSTKSCRVHKHAMCDNKEDCVDLADEDHPDCRSKTNATCKRRVGAMSELPIPLSWLKDGIWDCENGADETADWPTCGQGQTLRFVASSEIECENVFLCRTGNPGYIDLNNLCDGLETCGNENAICSVSSRSQSVTTSILTTNKGLTKQFSYCLKGLLNMQFQMATCANEHFTFPDEVIFGVDTKTSLILPNVTTKCDNLYGESYLYTSCTGRCTDAPCPLKTIPRYEACPNQLPNRVGTIVNNEYLIFFMKSYGTIYTNNYFVCKDMTKCIEYSKVCDLVSDCNDNSDEANCVNHFKCNSSGKLIPKTKQCDGHIDCVDLSDECNKHCSKEILEGVLLKGISWIIGLLAVLANSIIIGKSMWTLKQCKTVAAVMNRCLIIMIALGDLLIGCYLLTIAVYDTIVFGKYYCQRQISWITSLECSLIGVLSTIGSQISLFSMTILSVVRIHGIWNSMRIPGEVTLAQVLKIASAVVCLILASAAIAIIPVMKRFEDFYVNGLKFLDGLKIFIGTPNKETVLQVIEAYYGRTKEATLRWKTLIQMVQHMFSHDKNYKDLTTKIEKVDFYGNDGVCLFKYFVQAQDPQKLFVWGILLLNFICFIFISLSYLLIGILSRRSSKSLASSQNSRQINQRNQRMNQRIAIIITTDFLCWVPFIVICILHSLAAIDATAWYSIFSMVILPINSVINPLLYDDIVTSSIGAAVRSFSTRATNSTLSQSLRKRFNSTQADPTELESQVGNKGTSSEQKEKTKI